MPSERKTPYSTFHSIRLIKLNAFFTHDRDIWFATLELQFKAHKIVNQVTQLIYPLELVLAYVAASLNDLVLFAPRQQLWDHIEKAPSQHHFPSPKERLPWLSRRHSIGDKKSIPYSASLRSLVGSADEEFEVAWELWLQSIPVAALLRDLLLDSANFVADKIDAPIDSVADCSPQRLQVILQASITVSRQKRTTYPRPSAIACHFRINHTFQHLLKAH